jgi:predicted ATPase
MIRRIEALNYRSLRYVTQKVRPFQILVGPNASGKSTFLDVPAFLGDFVRNGLDNALLFNNRSALIQGRASRIEELFFNQTGDHFELAIELDIPRDLQKNNYDVARYEVRFGTSVKGELEIRNENFALYDAKPWKEGVDLMHSLFPMEYSLPTSILKRDTVKSGAKTIAIKKHESGNNYFADENTNWGITFKTSPLRSALGDVPEDIERFPITIWARNLLSEGIQTIALNSAAMRKPVSPSTSREFQVDGSNLPLVIQELKRKNPKRFADWLAHVQTILSGLCDISVIERPEDRHVYLALHYTNLKDPVPTWLVSDGTLRVLALTLIAYLEEQNRIYLIEEPENGIHPKALEGIYQSLSSVYDGQVLVATHSPLFLGLSQSSDLLCFAKTPTGATDIVAGDQHPNLKQWQGQVNLQTLYAAGVLG